jgi:hypothetical protein
MMQLWGMLSVLFLVVILVAYFKFHKVKDRKDLQAKGINQLKELRLVLYFLQKHRGLSSQKIKGKTGLETSIIDIQTNTQKIITRIASTNGEIKANELWLSVTEHWGKLSINYANYSVDNNVSQHNSMIQNLLYLIDDIAVSHELSRLKLPDIEDIRLIWKEWLTAIECIGQARALGSVILAEGICSSVSRIRLSYLQEKITVTTQLAWKGVPASESQRSLIHCLLACIKIEIINASNSNSLSLDSSDYFIQCSEVMDVYYQEFDQVINGLRV